jgi:hypothetical protein
MSSAKGLRNRGWVPGPVGLSLMLETVSASTAHFRAEAAWAVRQKQLAISRRAQGVHAQEQRDFRQRRAASGVL